MLGPPKGTAPMWPVESVSIQRGATVMHCGLARGLPRGGCIWSSLPFGPSTCSRDLIGLLSGGLQAAGYPSPRPPPAMHCAQGTSPIGSPKTWAIQPRKQYRPTLNEPSRRTYTVRPEVPYSASPSLPASPAQASGDSPPEPLHRPLGSNGTDAPAPCRQAHRVPLQIASPFR